MSILYLKNQPWSRWTRDERYFCSILYAHAHRDAIDFASWLIRTANLPVNTTGHWDLGYEVCFYRDYLWQLDSLAKKGDLPLKRTFDLCLFGETTVIIIEAKVCEPFDAAQNKDFERDKSYIKSLPGLESLNVFVIALASSRYFQNSEQYGRPGTLEVFDGQVSWSRIAQKYPDRLFDQADGMYKLKPGLLL